MVSLADAKWSNVVGLDVYKNNYDGYIQATYRLRGVDPTSVFVGQHWMVGESDFILETIHVGRDDVGEYLGLTLRRKIGE